MSWVATAWAKHTKGHRSQGEKLLLLVLAEYADPETFQAWPSQSTLAEVCMMTERTVIACLNHLAQNGYITRLNKGNQYQPSHYKINVGSLAQIHEDETVSLAPTSLAQLYEGETGAVSLAQIYEGETNATETDAPTKVKVKPEQVKVKPEQVKVKPEASEGEIPVGTNRQEPSIEPSVYIYEEDRQLSEDQTVWPDWYATLWAIPGFKVSLNHAEDWRLRKNISEEKAEITAYSLKSKWPGDPKKPFTDPWATFQNWVKRPPLSTNNQRPKDNLERLRELERGASRGRPVQSI